MNINAKMFEKIHNVLQTIQDLQNTNSYGEQYKFETKFFYRKNEYVWEICMECDLGGNATLKDVVIVWFNDSDDQNAEEEDFDKALEEIQAFVAKVQKIKNF